MRRVDLAQQQRPAVPQLPGPLTELVAAVNRGHGAHARPQGIAAEHLQRGRTLVGRGLPPVGGPPQGPCSALAQGRPAQVRQGHARLRRGQPGAMG